LHLVFAHAPVYFVTFCTYRRRRWLATEKVHAAFLEFGERAAQDHNVAVGRYVLLPDHAHLFVCGVGDFELGRWMGKLKQAMGKAVVRPLSADPIWQRGFFDHLLRSDESYAQKWGYVRENPVRAGLVAQAEDWCYAGELVRIDRA
jgi:REP element-mobilizing transposase RayT